jgi:hypothetical protein
MSSAEVKLRYILILIFVPVLANFGLLSGISHCDPESFHSALTIGFRPDGIPGAACFVDPAAGYITQPLGFLGAQDWLHGIVPWWNPYTGVGMPLAAEMQTESFFLPFVLLLHFHSGWMIQRLVFQILSGLFTYAFLLELPVAPAAALFGGLLYSLNGAFILTAGPVPGTIFCLPMLMLGIEKVRTATLNSTGPGWSLLTLALALSVYAGFPEVAFFNGLFALGWALLRFCQMQAGLRRRFLGKIVVGGLTGIALTAPLTLAFAEYLSVAVIGPHGSFLSQYVLPGASAPIQLMPLFYGALALPETSQLPGAILGDMWARLGGWFGCAPALLAVYALFAPAPQKRAERVFLALWVLAWECRYFGLPGATAVFNMIPGIALADAVRFSTVSVMFAVFCLAASGFNDAACGMQAQPRRLYGSLLVFGAGLCLAVAPALRILPIWFHAHEELVGYAAVYLGCTAASFALLVYGLRFRCGLRAAGAMIVAGSVGVFLLPQFYGTVQGWNEGDVAKLQSIIGLSRFYTTGPFSPNYPAMDRIASINFSQLPSPGLWSDYISGNLFPDSYFYGGGREQIQDWALIDKFPNYEAIGVKYVVTLPDDDPFQWRPSPQLVSAPPGFVKLIAGAEISGTIPARNLPAAKITGVSVTVGTYGGGSTGTLQAELCVAGKCAIGEEELSHIADESWLNISLDKPLELSPGGVLTYKFTHSFGRVVAVWLASGPGEAGGAATSVTALPNGAAKLVFALNETETAPVTYLSSMTDPGKPPVVQEIFHDESMNVYQLPNPAPYAELADKSCTLAVMTRQKMIARCAHPTDLIRRELFFPGWRAKVNGSVETITKTQGIFQGVVVPAGVSEIQFFYMPPYTYGACAIAILAALFWGAAGVFGSRAVF